MFWTPVTLRDWVWLLWTVLTDPAPKQLPLSATSVRITCPHCGRTY